MCLAHPCSWQRGPLHAESDDGAAGRLGQARAGAAVSLQTESAVAVSRTTTAAASTSTPFESTALYPL